MAYQRDFEGCRNFHVKLVENLSCARRVFEVNVSELYFSLFHLFNLFFSRATDVESGAFICNFKDLTRGLLRFVDARYIAH